MSTPTVIDRPGLNEKILFWASFFTLIAAGIGFSVRGFILKDWGSQFGFTQSELGNISGGGLVGFGIAIIFFSFFADRFGYGKLMLVAFLLHASSAVVTLAAGSFTGNKPAAYNCLNIGMWLFALGNGTCEAVINPLTAALFPNRKTHWLNILHAGWPLGLILGAVIGLGFQELEPGSSINRWEFKLGIFLVPVLIYGLLMCNRRFPRSEADVAGVSMSSMMGTIGAVGFAVAAGLIGVLLSNLVPTLLREVGVENPPAWSGWAAAGAIWLLYVVVSGFRFGSLLIAFLYVMHALVGYVELGTDSWITNITERVLRDERSALLAFIWTNLLMFILRFFAGPIVHRINPIGLLFVSALLGTAGLAMLGLPFTDSVWPWVAAVTVYGIGKTFYWPTMLGVISERFPKGGALALGISGGIGMLSAGLLGTPGIGYKQDYAAVDKLQETDAGKEIHDRYLSRKTEGEDANKPDLKGFPVVSKVQPEWAPMIAGLDNGKLKVFDDYKANLAKAEAAEKTPPADGKPAPKVLDQSIDEYIKEVDAAKEAGKPAPNYLLTSLQSDLVTLAREKAAGNSVNDDLEESLKTLQKWWEEDGKPHFTADRETLEAARTYGAKRGLLYTAAVPAALAVGFLLLLLYFAAIGGYKQLHLDKAGGVHAAPSV